MTEEYILERLALFCSSSLMLSIDGSKRLPDPPGTCSPEKPCMFSNPNTPPQVDTCLGLLSQAALEQPHGRHSASGPSQVGQHSPLADWFVPAGFA